MKFKCVYTGQVYEFTSEHDIKTMLSHPEYTKVEEAEEVKPVVKTPTKKQSVQTEE